MHPGDEGEPDTMTLGELIAHLSSLVASSEHLLDWPMMVRVCSSQNFDCVIEVEDIHFDMGQLVLCVGSEALDRIIDELVDE